MPDIASLIADADAAQERAAEAEANMRAKMGTRRAASRANAEADEAILAAWRADTAQAEQIDDWDIVSSLEERMRARGLDPAEC